jgi:hypothetical protein
MYVVVSLEYLEKFILPIDKKSGRYNGSAGPWPTLVQDPRLGLASCGSAEMLAMWVFLR